MSTEPLKPPRPMDWTVDDTAPLPATSSSARPWLFIVFGNDRHRYIELLTTPTTIGRGREANVVISDDRISKVHCTVRIDEEGQIEVVDNGSRNGTFVAGQRVEKGILRSDAELRIGTTVLRVEHRDGAQVKLEQDLFRAAVTDPLTGIPNRRSFDDRARAELARVQRHGNGVSAVFIDADHFKQINDTHGHATGDAVLKEIARRIASTCRADDAPCRYGGEEFVVLLSNAGLEQAAGFGERIRNLVQATPVGQVAVTVSVGVSAYRAGDTLETLLARADAAVYRAKERGRNRVEREE